MIKEKEDEKFYTELMAITWDVKPDARPSYDGIIETVEARLKEIKAEDKRNKQIYKLPSSHTQWTEADVLYWLRSLHFEKVCIYVYMYI